MKEALVCVGKRDSERIGMDKLDECWSALLLSMTRCLQGYTIPVFIANTLD